MFRLLYIYAGDGILVEVGHQYSVQIYQRLEDKYSNVF